MSGHDVLLIMPTGIFYKKIFLLKVNFSVAFIIINNKPVFFFNFLKVLLDFLIIFLNLINLMFPFRVSSIKFFH